MAFERLLNINVLATAVCINRAVRSMRQRNVEGHIFNINRYCCSRASSPPIVHPSTRETLSNIRTPLYFVSLLPSPLPVVIRRRCHRDF